MSLAPRRTVRISDAEWDAGHAKAPSEGDNLTSVLRRLLEGCLAGHRIEYRATSKHLVNGKPHVVTGLRRRAGRHHPPLPPVAEGHRGVRSVRAATDQTPFRLKHIGKRYREEVRVMDAYRNRDEPDSVVFVRRSHLDPTVWYCVAANMSADISSLMCPGRLRAVKRYAEARFGDEEPFRWVRRDVDTWAMEFI